MINKHPTKCNVCGGDVVYTSNAIIHGRPYGSGYCYYCTKCGAYTGTQEPFPRQAIGLLADKDMRNTKRICNDLFNNLLQNESDPRLKKEFLYKRLAVEMDIPLRECNLEYFDLKVLKRVYSILLIWTKEFENQDAFWIKTYDIGRNAK